jgi:dienelactone hydrolase
MMPSGMNESVIRIPLTGAQVDLSLEATLFKPDGDGPFPIVIFNHGKERGDPKQQKRSRPLALAREFVQRGYAVLAPNREGFANSNGSYSEQTCGIEELGLQQAADVAAAVHYIKQQPFAQTNRIVIIGASEGGLASIAYGEQPAAGVLGIVNFSGGLRQDACDTWQQAMIDAFHSYGERSQIQTLWFYGDNDQFWPSSLAPQLFSAYRAGGGKAMMIDFGSYKDNAHRLVGDRDSVPVWWPGVARFLHRLGMPTKVRFAVPRTVIPPATGFAPLQAVDAVPYLDAEGRAGYQNFLEKYPTRAFALSDSGAWSWAEGGDDPVSVALDSCQRNSRDACHLYAVDNAVVWPVR